MAVQSVTSTAASSIVVGRCPVVPRRRDTIPRPSSRHGHPAATYRTGGDRHNFTTAGDRHDHRLNTAQNQNSNGETGVYSATHAL